MTTTDDARPWISARGGLAALSVYALYLLSIPSAGVFALIGVIVAYVLRQGAIGVARTHLDDQIRIWWIAFLWGVALLAGSIVGWILAPLLIGFPILWIVAFVGFLVMVWFTVKSILGLIALLEGRTRGGGLI